MNIRTSYRVVCLMFTSIVFATCGGKTGGQDLSRELQSDESVETISVMLQVGAGGSDLDEPVALDLGLGFPLWLEPLGREPDEVAPFGAIPQRTTADTTLRAGASATFTFSASESDPGKDELKATPQLLSGVQIADISRVGFASRGETDWILGDYEVRINGKLVASKSESLASSTAEEMVDGKASLAAQSHTVEAATNDVTLPQSPSSPKDDSGAVSAGRDKSAEEDVTTEGVKTGTSEAGSTEDTSISQQDEATLKVRLADLQSLVKTGLASAEDKDHLTQVQAALEKLANAQSPQLATTASPAMGPVNHDSVLQVQEAARLKRTSLETTISELQSELQKLESLAELQLIEAVDEQKASEVESQLKSLRLERDQLNRQLDGKFPWFIDPQFTSPWRDDTTIESAKVTLVTEEHLGADTQNYVYLRIGGHKYLLGSPAVPLAGATGPQEFTLQMDSGPLTKSDLRGWAVGMLGSPLPFGKAPDRWHPKRIIIKLDGQIAYDSEEVETDRNSLAAIRLIPPAHYDEDGNLVVNKPIDREVFVWEAGKAAGLNLADGGAFDLPDANDPNYPQSEPGLPQQTSPEDSFADSSLFPGEQGGTGNAALAGASGLDASGLGTSGLGTSGLDAWGTGSSALDSSGFDSSGLDSSGLGSWGSGSGGYGGYGSPGDYGNGWGSSGGYGSGWGSDGTIPDQDFTVPPSTPPVPPEKDPPATGTPFQIESVRITAGWTSIDKFTVEWNVAGDESEIDFYNVALRVVRPDKDQVFFSNVLRAQVSAGSRSYTGTIDSSAGVSEPYYFIAPVVTAVSKDSQQTPHERIGPARAVFPASSSLKPFIPLQLDSRFGTARTSASGLPTLTSMPVSYSGKPAGSNAAVWTTQAVEESHNAILFDNPAPALTVAARPTAQDDKIIFSLSVPSLQQGVYKLVGHLGYLGKTSANSITTAEIRCRLDSAGSSTGTPLELTQKLTFGSVGRPDTSSAAPMAMLEQVIDTAKLKNAAQAFDLFIEISLAGKSLDPLHPAAVFGLRLLPETLTVSSPSIVKAGKLLSPKMTVKTFDYQTFGNSNWPDLVCRVESGLYASSTSSTHFLDLGRVKVTVENLGGKPSKQCKIGIISVGPPLSPKTPIELADKTPKGIVKGKLKLIPPPTTALPGTGTGTGPSTKINWIATESVPPLLAKEKKDVYLALPNSLTQALGEDLSSERYRVMVDMDEQYAVQEDDDPKGPGETNNWSNTFFIKEGPYIASFVAKQNTLVPGQKLEISGAVYGSSRWDLTYEWLETNTSLKKVFNTDPLQKKPFPSLSTGAFMTLPWLPWSLNQPEMDYPKLKVTLTAYNSTGTRKDSKDVSLDLNDFDGTFKVKEAKATYMEQDGKVVGTMKVEYDCDKPFKVGLFGDPGFGSVYVRCQILNPVEPVDVWLVDPNSVSIKLPEFHILCNSVYKEVHCVVPDAPKLKAQQAYVASMSPLPIQDLPAKGTFLVAWEADIGQTKLEAISRKSKIGSKEFTDVYQPVVRSELRIHTGKQIVSLKERIELVAPTGTAFGSGLKNMKFSEVDESLFLKLEDWDW